MRKITLYLFFLFGLSFGFSAKAQTFSESKEHKKLWRRWNKKKDGYNPYVKHEKSTHEQSKKDARASKRLIKKANKEYKKQQRKLIRQGKLHKPAKK